MDLSKMSPGELNRLKTRIDAELARRVATAKRDLMKKVEKLAADAGVPLDELIGTSGRRRTNGKKAAAKGRKVAPKYRNPADASQTWTGRGRQPAWVVAYLKGGKKIDNLLIK